MRPGDRPPANADAPAPSSPPVGCGWRVPLFPDAFGWVHACRSDRIATLGSPKSTHNTDRLGCRSPTTMKNNETH